MIPRYARPEMTNLWTDQSRFEIWLEVETLALEAMAKEGLVPESDVAEVRRKGAFDKDRVLEIENEVKHDVIAFLTNVAEYVGPAARTLHRGMTSSDLLDTTFAVQLKRSGELILAGLETLGVAMKKRAEEHKWTPCIGRSHGIHAEPITFGLKLAGWYAELARNKRRLKDAIAEVSVSRRAGRSE